MKKSLFPLFFLLTSIFLSAQPSKVHLFLEDNLGRKDTIIFGSASYNPSSTLGIDSLLGEVNIYGIPYDSLDMRVIQRDTFSTSCLYGFYNPPAQNPPMFFPENIDSKIDFRPSGNFFTANHNFELFLQAFDYPVVIKADFSELYPEHLFWSSISSLNQACEIIQEIVFESNIDTLFIIEDNTVNTFLGHIRIHTATEELKNPKHQWKVFPNPAKNNLRVEDLTFKSGNLEIIDLTGRILAHYAPGNANSISLNIESLEKGIYFLRYSNQFGELVSTKKFLKN